jgi:predicted NUDIX family NTP pyrophosphohydrolase
MRSNTFQLEWPPKSGQLQECPAVDRAGWFVLEIAKRYILKAQIPLLDSLKKKLSRLSQLSSG